MPHPNVDPGLSREIEQKSLDLNRLEPGRVVRLELAEGEDYEVHFSLDMRLTDIPPEGECPEFEVIASDVPESIIEKNRKYGLLNPDFVGQKILVRGGCSFVPGYQPTMVHVSNIDLNRSVWLAYELPNDSRGPRSMGYFPYVRGFRLMQD